MFRVGSNFFFLKTSLLSKNEKLYHQEQKHRAWVRHRDSHSKANPSAFTLPTFQLFQKADRELQFLVMPDLDSIWGGVLGKAGC